MDNLFELIFFAVALIAWIAKSVIDERERRRKPPPRPRPEGVEIPEGEPEAVFPPPIDHRGDPRASRPSPVAGAYVATRGRLVMSDAAREAETMLRAKAGEAGELWGARRARQIASIRRRLTGCATTLGSARQISRAGILWREILGPPRSVTGPHRSPAAERYGARRR